MNTYIFITNEGYTYQPNSDSIEPDCENAQVIGFANGRDDEEAIRNLIKENEWISETSFNEIICYKLDKSSERTMFTLEEYKKK